MDVLFFAAIVAPIYIKIGGGGGGQGESVRLLFCFAVLCLLPKFVIILLGKCVCLNSIK